MIVKTILISIYVKKRKIDFPILKRINFMSKQYFDSFD